MKNKIDKEMFDAIKSGDIVRAQWLLNHQKVRVHKQSSAGLKTPYASTIQGTVIMEHLDVQPRLRRDGNEPTYVIADLSVPGQVTLTVEGSED